ncbi:adenylate cyclase [Monoraphidium neglectum]|uniref:Adenylate cyclase n=1 Tax=Monoraphidium neglectum TaxID=145388 RepID=A0A0D2M8J2_9CHLO|nr:adenylate cyclase [Monoraphidium neglectum]KIY97406.1 adenylate cyclase [Monoraphidium neglectum]|eukprot:XP_013896426.1 adenylate cyclase [Monoraphidium neglectum]
MLLALWAALAGISMNAALAQDWQAALHQFSHQDDLPQQRAALLTLLDATGASSKLHATQQAQVVGSPGLFAWATPNTSYCTWWGVNCCSATLTASLQLCLQGTNSVSGLHVVAVNLTGQLPDVFEDLPDLQLLAIAYNRGLVGPLPPSIGKLQNLWSIDATGTSLTCSGVAPFDEPRTPPRAAAAAAAGGAACPLPGWLMFTDDYYFQPNMLECPGITFTTPRDRADLLQRAYVGASSPEVYLESFYYENSPKGNFCGSADMGSGKLAMPDASVGLPIVVLVILVPFLAVSVGLVLLSVALMRYLRYLKRSHDAIHLTEGWKRRNPPGLISDGNDRVLREVTIVITDVEGSTELWEWDGGVMDAAQEIHDSLMRDLISKYCGFEVTTEGDSFTVAFHDAFDAVSWALAMQQAMLEADWPEALLSHEKAAVVLSDLSDSSRPGTLLFRGLRVRVAVSTGIPTVVQSHDLTSSLSYAGPVMDMASALSDLPAGGQILMGPATFSSIAPRLAEMGVRLLLAEPDAPVPEGARKWYHLFRRARHDPAFAPAASPSARLARASTNGRLMNGSAALRASERRRLGALLSRGSSLAFDPAAAAAQLPRDMEAPPSESKGAGRGHREHSVTGFVGDAHAGAPPGAADNEHVPMVIDLGSHWLDGVQLRGQCDCHA